MNVRIDDITTTGLRFDEGVSQPRLDDMLTEAMTGYQAVAAMTVDVRLSRAGVRIIIEGTLSTRVRLPCRRCLGGIDVDLPITFQMDLLPLERREAFEEELPAGEASEEDERAGSFSLEVADREYYDGDTIDMWPILREQVLLALPDYPLCDEGCKGLCQTCGKDLNTGTCECEHEDVDPRWAGLSRMKVT